MSKMKVIILSEVEQFCRDHNFHTIGLETLREMAVSKADDDGLSKAYKAGYAKAHQAIIDTLARERP